MKLLNYLKGTKSKLDAVQEKFHKYHMDDIGTTNDAYKNSTTAFVNVWKPKGQTFWVMAIPGRVVKKKSLIDKMDLNARNLSIVKSNESWFSDGGLQ